jgi:hypothetical protein
MNFASRLVTIDHDRSGELWCHSSSSGSGSVLQGEKDWGVKKQQIIVSIGLSLLSLSSESGYPLIAIIVADKFGHSLPISAIDRVKEMYRVQPNLLLRSPQPEQIQSRAKGCAGPPYNPPQNVIVTCANLLFPTSHAQPLRRNLLLAAFFALARGDRRPLTATTVVSRSSLPVVPFLETDSPYKHLLVFR